MLTFASAASIYVRLGPGSLSGQLFADVCDQLLLTAAQSKRIRFTPHSDRAGDYLGLDSFSEGDPNFDGLRGKVGFQYKFFPSESAPLSRRNKSEIIESIRSAKAKNRGGELACWILITPEDFNQHQLAWFSGLARQLKCPFELRQWGQKQLSQMMARHPETVAHIYPDLVASAPRIDWRHYCTQLLGRLKHPARHGDAFIRLTLSDGRDIDQALRDFTSPRSDHVLFCLLGSYGAGKTTVLEHYSRAAAEAFVERRGSMVPLLIRLRHVRGTGPFRQTVLDYLQSEYGLPLDFMSLQTLIANGSVIVILDGLDEKEEGTHRGHELVRLREVFDLLAPPGKLIVSSRTEYFTDAVEEQVAILGRHREVALRVHDSKVFSSDPKAEITYLSLLRPEQIRAHVMARAGADGEALLRKIGRIYDLTDLVSRPVLLDMVCKTVPLIEETEEPILRSTLYILYTNQQLENDVLARGMEIPTSDRVRAIEDLAEYMVVSGSIRVHHREIAEKVGSLAADASRDFLSTSFLTRDAAGTYEFSHLSFLEYFSARRMLAALRGETASNRLWKHVVGSLTDADHTGGLSMETFRFFQELVILRIRLARQSGQVPRYRGIDPLPVSLDRFNRFVEATGYRAERVVSVLGFAGVCWRDAQAFAAWNGSAMITRDELRGVLDSEWPQDLNGSRQSIYSSSPVAPIGLSDSWLLAVRSYREWTLQKYLLSYEWFANPGRYPTTYPASGGETALFRCRQP